MQLSSVSVRDLPQRPGTAGFLVALSLQRALFYSQHLQLLPGNCVSLLLYIILPAELAGQGPALKEISLPDP